MNSRRAEHDIKCKVCDIDFENRRNLMEHVKEEHPRKIRCLSCEEVFNKNSDLEAHIKTYHETIETYKCDICEKTFVLKWRLNKHQENHTSLTTKKCHYYNNKKECPYEDIGCMFEHVLSEMCIFGKNCQNKLCSNQHELENPEIQKVKDPVDKNEKSLKDKFEKLSVDDQYESKMIICDKLCKASYGYHRCTNEDYDDYVGCDTFNITEDFDDDCNKTEYFPCEECDKYFEEYAKVREHFLTEHKPYEMIGCIDKECKLTVKSIDMLVMHIGVDHNDLLKQRL